MKQYGYIASAVCLLILSGCSASTKNSVAESIAESQVQKINQSLPAKAAGYTLVFAQQQGAEIGLTLVADNQSAARMSPSAVLAGYQQGLCSDPTVRTYLAKGVSYRLQVNNLQGSNLQAAHLTAAQCASQSYARAVNRAGE